LAFLCAHRLFSAKSGEAFYGRVVTLGIVGITLAIPLADGGDHFGYSRFMQPTAPLIFLGLVLLLQGLRFPLNYRYALIVIVFSTFIPRATVYSNLFGMSSPIGQEWELALRGRSIGEHLNEFFRSARSYPTQGIIASGGMAYAYKGQSNDVMG